MGKVKIINCPKCNASFECYSETDEVCWCNAIKLSNEVLAELSKTFKGCLCKDCIKEFSIKNDNELRENQ